jgi:Tfp pilus assembly protein FimT
MKYNLRHHSRGLTLIEALIVLFMVSIISVMAAPGMMKWRSAAKLRGAIENLKGDLEFVKLKAIQENGPVAVNFSKSSYQVFRDDGTTVGVHDVGEELFAVESLPDGITIDLSATTFADDGFGGKRTRFKGRGTADAGTVFLINSRGNVKKVVVSSVGRIRTE